ncbi:MAG TPA: class I SAM-dependent methyltransferase [Steroidobacteraceae bacterium]
MTDSPGSQAKALPPITQQTSFWNSWNSAHREQRAIGAAVQRRAGQILETIRSLGLAQPTILEAGCGSGWMCDLLSQLGRVTGLDLADEVIARARINYPQVRFFAGDILTTDVGEGYDVVVNMEVLSHVYDQPRFIARLWECLRPGGHLLMTTQNRFVYERRSDIAPLQPGQVRRWLNRREVRELLRPRFEIVRMVTMDPAGHRGILRIVNSVKLDRLTHLLGLGDVARRAKEAMGFGDIIFVHARKIDVQT